MKRRSFRRHWHLNTNDAIDYFDAHGLDCTKDSRQIQDELGDEFRCVIPKSVVALAAVLTGHAVLPARHGTFRFCKVSQ